MKKLISWVIRKIPRKYLQRVAGPAMKVLSLLYAGNRVECPVCGRRFRKFLPYGRINSRPNALCPSCMSLERHRLIWLYLQNKSAFFKGKKDVLHVAPEACFMKPFERIHGDGYITADIESPLAKVKMDVHQIPFADNRFDFVLCNHVLEHVDDDIQAMREINRVLKPGGLAILQVPFFHPIPDVTYEDPSITDPREREKAFGQDDHLRKFGRDYVERMQRAGLAGSEDDFVYSLPAEQAQRFGLAAGELIYIGRKKQGRV